MPRRWQPITSTRRALSRRGDLRRRQTLVELRIALLPYLGHEELFKQFELKKPWDSPKNKALAAKIPAVYQTPGGQADGKTRYVVPAGLGTIFGGHDGMAEGLIGDGKEIPCAGRRRHGSSLTQPDDLHYFPAQPLAGLGKIRGGKFLTASPTAPFAASSAGLDSGVVQALFSAMAMSRSISPRSMRNSRTSAAMPATAAAPPTSAEPAVAATPTIGPGPVAAGTPAAAAKPAATSSKFQTDAIAALVKGKQKKAIPLLQADAARGNPDVVNSLRWSKALKKPSSCSVAAGGAGAELHGGSARCTAPRHHHAAPARRRRGHRRPSIIGARHWASRCWKSSRHASAKAASAAGSRRRMALANQPPANANPDNQVRTPVGRSPTRGDPQPGRNGGRRGPPRGLQGRHRRAHHGRDREQAGEDQGSNPSPVQSHAPRARRRPGRIALEIQAGHRRNFGSDAGAGNDGGKDAGELLSDVLEFLDKEVLLRDMPKLTAEEVQEAGGNAGQANVQSSARAWPSLRCYASLKLLTPEQLADFYTRLIGSDDGPRLATGGDQMRLQIMEKLLGLEEK